jgi:hypothetical protein
MLCFAKVGWNRMNYTKNNQVRQKTASIVSNVQQATQRLDALKTDEAGYDKRIETQFEPFKYREVVPELYETIVSALPNEKNTPEQARVYEAFVKGDVAEIKKIPRNQRKQIFLTNISIYYANDLATAQFGGADQWRKSRATPGTQGEGYEGMEEYEMMMSEEMMGYDMGMYPPGFMPGTEAQEQKKQGFVVTAIGYSPYGTSVTELGTLLDPHGVDTQREKWGFVTRLANLDAIVPDGNSPFVLYERTDPEQFKLEMKEVSLLDVESTPPEGVGMWQEQIPKTSSPTSPRGGTAIEWALVDPMTNEIISKIAEKDENGVQKLYRGKPVFKINDHWFVLSAKFVWKDAPAPPPPPAGMFPFGGPSAPSAMPSPPPSSGSSGRKSSTPDMDM